MPEPPPVGAAEIADVLRRVSGKNSPEADGWQLCHLWPPALVEVFAEFCGVVERTGLRAGGFCKQAMAPQHPSMTTLQIPTRRTVTDADEIAFARRHVAMDYLDHSTDADHTATQADNINIRLTQDDEDLKKWLTLEWDYWEGPGACMPREGVEIAINGGKKGKTCGGDHVASEQRHIATCFARDWNGRLQNMRDIMPAHAEGQAPPLTGLDGVSVVHACHSTAHDAWNLQNSPDPRHGEPDRTDFWRYLEVRLLSNLAAPRELKFPMRLAVRGIGSQLARNCREGSGVECPGICFSDRFAMAYDSVRHTAIQRAMFRRGVLPPVVATYIIYIYI